MKKFLLSLAVALASVLSVSAEDFKCVQKESEGEIFTSELKDGAIVVTSASGAKQDWDTQFWIVLPEPVAADTKIDVAFDYKASDAIKIGTQAHGIPGGYHHWQACGEVSFTSDWQSFKNSFTVTSEMTVKNADTPDDVEGFQSIAFNLSVDKEKEVVYYFKNVKVTVDGTEYTYATEAVEPEPEPEPEPTPEPEPEPEPAPSIEYIVDDPQAAHLGGWGGEMKAYDEDGVRVIDNPSTTENNWQVQVAYDTDFEYQVDAEYVFEFDIKGSVEGTTFAAGLQNTDGYKGCGEFGNVNVTTEWQSVKLTTKCTGEGAKRLVISIGDYAGKLYVKNVKVYDSAAGIANVTAGADAAAFNLFGQKSNGAGFTVKAGKVYLVK